MSKEKPGNHNPTQNIEKIMISIAVLRKAGELPPHLVSEHENILKEYGIVGQALNEISNVPKKKWLELIDRLQQNQ